MAASTTAEQALAIIDDQSLAEEYSVVEGSALVQSLDHFIKQQKADRHHIQWGHFTRLRFQEHGGKQLWEELEKEDIPSYIRESRLEALKKQSQQYHAMKEKQHGEYSLLEDEKMFLDITTSVTLCVVHFFHPDFRRCAIIDGHLQKLSQKYFETKFARISVEKAKFLVNKLKIQILPAVYCFKKGIVVDKIIGFEELGNTDDFRTEVLERRFAKSGSIEMAEDEDPKKKTIFGVERQRKQDDDSSDEDDD